MENNNNSDIFDLFQNIPKAKPGSGLNKMLIQIVVDFLNSGMSVSRSTLEFIINGLTEAVSCAKQNEKECDYDLTISGVIVTLLRKTEAINSKDLEEYLDTPEGAERIDQLIGLLIDLSVIKSNDIIQEVN